MAGGSIIRVQEAEMEISQFIVTPFMVNCYVVKDGDECIVIDPGDASPPLVHEVLGSNVKMIVNTHCHCDHCGGNGELMKLTGADLAIHREDLPMLHAAEMQGKMFGITVPPSPEPTVYLAEGDTVKVGAVELSVVHAPGHSPGHILLVGDGFAFVGDVLFAGSIGRTDLPGGDTRQLMESLRTKILTLPDDMVAYSGHGPSTTIGDERMTNPFLVGL
jgi:glyoxylase-like metal-dependent hydrolase (beta-lactamase superfamily II)